MKGKILFKETQTFRSTFIFPISCIISGLMLVGIYLNLFQGDMKYESLWVALGTTTIIIGLLSFVWIHKLYIEIDKRTIRYSFYPYIRKIKTIRREDIKTVYVRKYKPIWEYGGWGFRIGLSKGRAYNIWGTKGLQIIFNNGDQLLIGTQKSKELHRVIERWNSEEEIS